MHISWLIAKRYHTKAEPIMLLAKNVHQHLMRSVSLETCSAPLTPEKTDGGHGRPPNRGEIYVNASRFRIGV